MIPFHFKLDSQRDTILREDKNRQVYEHLRAGWGEQGKAAGPAILHLSSRAWRVLEGTEI